MEDLEFQNLEINPNNLMQNIDLNDSENDEPETKNININENSDCYNKYEEEPVCCVICREELQELGKLNKICKCVDSLVCDNCVSILEDNNSKKCPVCRSNLVLKKKYHLLYNLKVLFKKQPYILSYIFFIIIVNVSLYLKYYKINDNYPDIKENQYNYKSEIYTKNLSRKLVLNNIIFQKNVFFLILNTIHIVVFPLTIFTLNSLLTLINLRSQEERNLVLKIVKAVFIIIDVLILIVVLFVSKTIDNLKFYLYIMVYTFMSLFILFLAIYYLTYYFSLSCVIKNNFMITTIKYKIHSRIYKNSKKKINDDNSKNLIKMTDISSV